MLPPLSKFYYGPAQGWGSTESSPIHNGPSWSQNHHDVPPNLPPRLSPGPPAYSSPQWMNHSPYSTETSQGWHSPDPPPAAPPPSQLTNVYQSSGGHPVMPNNNVSHVDPTWDTGPLDTSTWGVKYNQKAAQSSGPASKPQLPPRPPHQTPEQSVSPESKTPSSRLSATTIEVPVFLQPVAYDPASAPPLPGFRQPLPQDTQNSILSPPEPERLPPRPPQKIPLENVDTSQATKTLPQRPCHDPQHRYNSGQQDDSRRSQHPRFDRQYSHDAESRPYQWQSHGQRPTIPVPQFTSFNVESALPPPELQPEIPLPPQQTPAHSTSAHRDDLNHYEAGQLLHRSSISLEDPSAADRRVPTSSLWDHQAAYVPSPEQHHAVLLPQDGQSVSTTDLSIATVDVSTPGSHQTSSTSYREIENREDRRRPEHQSDDSFYWHSGRSSSDAEEEQDHSGSPTTTPGGDSVGQRSSATISAGLQQEHQDLPTRSTNLSPTKSATYSASALGFGGPSDWEYFGDYEAEEIDDEELYSRPRPRDLKSVVEGSTELPVDLTLDSTQSCNESDLPGPDLPGSDLHSSDLPNLDLIRPNSSLQATNSTRSLGEDFSLEHVVQGPRTSGDGDYQTDAKPLSAHGPITPHTASEPTVSSSDTHGQQRPDLDDIVRAWSEAPCVGKIQEIVPAAAVHSDSDEEPVNVAEASLASTPRERILGVGMMLNGAPSLPKLPDSLESHISDERELRRDGNTSAILSDSVLNATDHGMQMQLPPNQQEAAKNDPLGIAQVKPSREGIHDSENGSITPSVMPVGVSPSSGLSLSIPTEASTNEVSLDVKPSSDRCTESRTHGLTQASQEELQKDSYQKSHDSSEEVEFQLNQQIKQDIVTEYSTSDHREGCKRNSESKSKSVQNFKGGRLHEAIMVVSSLTSETLSRGTSPSRSSIASAEVTQEDDSPSLPQFTSKENLDIRDSVKRERDHPQEDVQTPESPSKDSATGAPAQAILPLLTSDNPLPEQTSSSQFNKVQDPYSDLDPWGKASLNRFAAMLREESRAETNQDKLSIFNVFTSRESRLRVVLYGTDDELLIPQKPVRQNLENTKQPEKGGFVKQAVDRANSIGLERSLKALPALPANRESVIGLPSKTSAPLIKQQSLASKGPGTDSTETLLKDKSNMPSGPLADDSYVMVDSPSDEIQYSPGGRPVIARLLITGCGADVESSQSAIPAVQKDRATSLKTPEKQRHGDPPSTNRIIAVVPEDTEASEKPAYTPLKYNEGRSEVKNYLANRKSVIRPYATLTQRSLESGSTFGQEESIKLVGAASIIMTPTSQYNSLTQSKGEGASDSFRGKADGIEGPSDLRRFVKADFDPLLLALPKSDPVVRVSAQILDLRNIMEAVPDDFSFIHHSVVAWDVKAKKQREENDRQRHARQVESEQKTDSLFDDHEIGYGDIAELEDEFKHSEAARKADEDRFEYQTFVSDVFNHVWTRLHYELDQLIPHYEQYSKLMDRTLAGRDMFEGSEEGLALGPTMSSFLALHQKIEIRHQKAFEAVLERDRRLKKTEISPWYSLSNIFKVKQLEKQFEDAEKKAIIEYCQQRDARANHLMDALDQNTLRGVGANQDYMEAIMKAVRRIASGRAFASVPGTNEPTAGLEEVEKAKAITALLASSSEQIVQTFHVADMLLNSADYEVSVAKAKVAKADMATLAKLKEERAKEDQKLMRDLEHRLALIREDTRRTNDEIVKLMLFLGVQNGRADTVDRKHEVRIEKALEEAKKWNALKESKGC